MGTESKGTVPLLLFIGWLSGKVKYEFWDEIAKQGARSEGTVPLLFWGGRIYGFASVFFAAGLCSG